jgi:tRNA uridine 5-carbamoylmethylation protein Kti12
VTRRTVRILTGLPGSGKTTCAMDILLASRGTTTRVNLDAIRSMTHFNPHGTSWTSTHEEMAAEIQDRSILTALARGFDVVVDNTHLTPRGPERIRRLLAGRPIVFVVHDLTHVPIEECVRRDGERTQPVGKARIEKMAAQYEAARETGWKLTASWMSQTRTRGAMR